MGCRVGRSERASAVAATQAEAIERGRQLAKAQHAELVIHGRNGQIRDSESFGGDPCPPKDTKH
jgi:hypothetical protein